LETVDAIQSVGSTPRRLPFFGVVLAGGKSRRMGRDKALLNVEGARLLDLQLARLGSVGAADRAVVLRDQATPAGLPDDVIILRDDPSVEGPFAGLLAALAASPHPLTLVMAVDLPALEPSILREILLRSRSGAGLVPRVDGRLEPLAAFYPAAALESARKRAANGRWDLKGLIEDGMEAGWMSEWAVDAAQWPAFANWNTPSDWVPHSG
jgi:molybdenum cofactor guanylyltransferase